LIIDFFDGIGLIFMEDFAPSIFLRNWVLIVSYLCFRFHIFDFPPIVREMHPSFENMVIIDALDLPTSLMDIHHNTSGRSIFEDGSIP
jgi:hypothetical protein